MLVKNFNIKDKIKNFDYFELGNSFMVYYFMMFFLLPLLSSSAPYIKSIKTTYFSNLTISHFLYFLYLIIGLFCFAIGYKVKFFNFSKIKENYFKKISSPNFGFYLLLTFIIFSLGLLIKYIRWLYGGYKHLDGAGLISKYWYSTIGLLDWFNLISLSLILAFYFYVKNINNNYKILGIFTYLILAIQVILQILTNSRFLASAPIIVYLIVAHYLSGKNHLRVVLAIFVILFIIFPIENFLRNPEVFYRSYNIQSNHFSRPTIITNYAIDSSIGRINQSHILLSIFRNTKEFLYGRDFYKFFISLGPPRFIWKNKPIIYPDGNELGRKLGVLDPSDYQTTIAPTIIGDLYLNFGLMGIIIGMIIFGFICRIIFDFFIKNTEESPLGVFVYSILWIKIIKGSEDFIIPTLSELVKLFIILMLIIFLLKQIDRA